MDSKSCFFYVYLLYLLGNVKFIKPWMEISTAFMFKGVKTSHIFLGLKSMFFFLDGGFQRYPQYNWEMIFRP